MHERMQAAGYTGKVKIGMDVAASEFYTEDKKYDLDFKNKDGDKSQIKTGQELLEVYAAFCKDYPIITIEDPFDQDDWENTTKLTTEGICQVGYCACRCKACMACCAARIFTRHHRLYGESA